MGRGEPSKTNTTTAKHPKTANKQMLHTHGHATRTTTSSEEKIETTSQSKPRG